MAGGPWFDLWSALCHQGDAYTASLAAVPHLAQLAPAQLGARRYDALLLVASIEQARLEGRAPPIPDGVRSSYEAALAAALRAGEAALAGWDEDSRKAISGSVAVLRGDLATAQSIFNSDSSDC